MESKEKSNENPVTPPARTRTVLHTRSISDLPEVQADLVGADARVADLFLRFVHETATAGHDAARLLETISEYTFRAFPQATHVVIAVREDEGGALRTLIARSRGGEIPRVALSRTLTGRVMSEGLALLFSETETPLDGARSILSSGIRTALVAPLSSVRTPFGVIQLDIRGKGKTAFHRRDLDRLTVFAHHVALVLDNLRLHQEQARALESTINALVHSLSLKDPDTALHSERVQAVSLRLGREFGLAETRQEALGMAAILHDMGKHGVRNEVLNKPGRLSQGERCEMQQHAGLTENILDKITFPAHLRDVPVLAAYHHEKMDGSGPYGLTGEGIPLEARIISVADAFDALISPRVYKKALPLPEVLDLLRAGAGKEWDPAVVETLTRLLPEILSRIYPGRDTSEQDSAQAA